MRRLHATRREIVVAGGAAALTSLLGGCAQPSPPKPYKPMPGQAGKDVIWIPTPDHMVQRMLDMAQVTPSDSLVDLGSGDGKIAIAAARRGARARGIEYNADMVALSKREAQILGVPVEFVQGDIFESDFTDADVVTMYLLPDLNERLRPILLDMKPGTRVASHEFGMGDWEPDRTDILDGRQAHLWIVPAKVAGDWTFRIEGELDIAVRIEQRYQRLDGHAVRDGQRVALHQARVRGAGIGLAVPDGGAGLLRFDGTADHPGRMSGTVTLPGGQRKRFTAVRS